MEQIFSRFAMLIGEEGIEKLKKSSVIAFGVGGVGSYVVESLARSGIGKITMVDFDEISESNINRQIHALKSTVGKSKIEIMKERILDINPECEVILKKKFVFENVSEIFEEDDKIYDFAVDAIDVIYSKVAIIEYCMKNNIKIISSMGFGNKMHPEKIELATIEQTSVCPMARAMRRILKKKGIKGLAVVYSQEIPLKPDKSDLYVSEEPTEFRENNELPNKITPGSNAFVPGTAGLVISAYVIRKLIGME